MDGIHDLGGRQGFGRIEVNEPEEQFHESWEARVRCIVNAMSRAPDWNIDWFRHCRELIDPVDYLTRPYFDQWIQTYCAMLINSGWASVEELSSGKAKDPMLNLLAPVSAAEVRAEKPHAMRFDAAIDTLPTFHPGALVRAKTHATIGHTRLPAYVRGRHGRVFDHHGAHVFPDDNARNEKCYQHLYTVEFNAAELWPETTDVRDSIYLNLWESYLDRA
jgi:nitrile hydratase